VLLGLGYHTPHGAVIEGTEQWWIGDYTSRQQTACFKVTAKAYNVATRTAEPKRVKKAQNSQRNKASNVVFLT
jgi:hypothetical protein